MYEILNLSTTKYEIHHEDWFDGIEISDKISSFEMAISPTKEELYVNYEDGTTVAYENIHGTCACDYIIK